MAAAAQRYHKTRIAPTPSGYLHLGNVLSFVITKALAEQFGATVLLRIDDMDRERADVNYIQDIFDTLNFLDIPWLEGPRDVAGHENHYSQIHRMGLYNAALDTLRKNGDVFACTCTRTQLKNNIPCTCDTKQLLLDTTDACWRLRTDAESLIRVNTLNGIIERTLPIAVQNFVIQKKDGYPSYQLTSVIDDLHFGVDLVVRGQDLWESTLAQLYLASKLEEKSFAAITFHHHPLLQAPSGQKLSKSAGDTSVQYLRRQGYMPEDIYNTLANMLQTGAKATNHHQLRQLIPIDNKQ